MLTCWIDYIGLNNCVGVYGTSPSGHYINSLPGLTWDNIDNIADTEQRTWEGVWADVQQTAIARFYTDALTAIGSCFQLSKDCVYEDILCDEDNMVKLTNAWKYLLGAQIMIERMYSPRLNRYTTVDREQAKELLDHYQVEYETYLKQAVKLLDTTECDLCCGGSVASVVWLP